MTQKETVREHLARHGTLTSWEAWERYGITRLSEYVMELRREGFPIETPAERIEVRDRFGNAKRIARYRLIER